MPLPAPVSTPWCSICSVNALDADDLVAAPDGKLECRRCRGEHPRKGNYSFAEGPRSSPWTGRRSQHKAMR